MAVSIDPVTGERIEDITIDPATGERKIQPKSGDVQANQHGASGGWQKNPTLTEALFPALTAARRGGDRTVADLISGNKPAGGGFGRQALGLGSDLVTGLIRVPAAAGRVLDTKMGWAGDHPQSYSESLNQINEGLNPKNKPSLISGMESDVATIPSLMMGGAGGTLGKTALSGLKAGLATAALHQGDKMARTGNVNLGDAAIETGLNTAFPVIGKGVGAALKSGSGALKTILSKFSDLDESALKSASNPEALAAAQDITRRTGGDLSGLADNLGQKISGIQSDESQAMAAVNARRQATLESGLQQARPWADNLNVSPYDVGKQIESAAQQTRKNAGERFQLGQDAILEKRGIGKKAVQFGGPDGNQTPFEQTVDKYLSDAGVGTNGKNYGVIGNVSIPPGAINEIRALKDTFKSGLTTRDMLDQLRLVDNKLNFGGPDGRRLFSSGSQEDLAMKGLRSRLADDLENQIGNAAGKKEKAAVVSAWNAHREAYAKTTDALEKIQDGLGAGTVNQESYFNRIKNVGIDDLRNIAAEAKKNPDLAPTWNELRKGFFDNIIASGIKEDGIDYAQIKKVWDTMDDDLKSTMLPTKVISHIDGVLDRTAPIDFKGSTLADNNRWAGRDRQSTLSALENIGSKAKRTDLEDLKTLDDLLGLEGKNRFSEQASDFYLGTQLGLTDKGNLPLFTGSRTGAKLAGAGVGATLGGLAGTYGGGAEGGSVGGGLGMLAGVAVQSPAGALAAYKLLNSIRKGVVVGERKAFRPLAQNGISLGRAGRTFTTAEYGEEKNK